MIDLTILAQYRDDVKTHRHVYAMKSHIGIGSQYYTSYLILGNGILRLAKTCIPAGLHFHNHQHSAFLSHNVYFLVSATPVTVQDVITFTSQIISSIIFTRMTQYIMLCHLPLC